MGIDSALNKAKVLEAFDLLLAPGIQKYVLARDFNDGKLFCTMSSSVARDRLSQLKTNLLNELNLKVGKQLVKDIILK